MISVYLIVDLYGGIARSLQVIVEKLGRAHLVISSIWVLGNAWTVSLDHDQIMILDTHCLSRSHPLRETFEIDARSYSVPSKKRI